MFRQVHNLNGIFTAIDELGRSVTIIESISFIYKVDVNPDDDRVTYRPVKYTTPKILKEVENFLTGKKYDATITDAIVIRFGWMDKRLNKLSFIGLSDLMAKGKEMSSTERRKVGAICKQLSISMKLLKK